MKNECDYLYGWIKKMVTYTKTSLKVGNSRDNIEEEEETEEPHWKAYFEIFYNLLSAPWTVFETAQVAWAQLCANHVQHIKLLSCATCSVPLGMKGQLSY